ncbi:MAG: hypothetical protein K6F55_11845 [Eubacterium sp.]|nr:hypothetical protein [Eubacterium sp.]
MKKGKKTARFITSFLMVLMLIAFLPVNSYAADSVEWHKNDEGEEDYPKKIVVNPYTYEMPDESTGITKELDGESLKNMSKFILNDWSQYAYGAFHWGWNEGGDFSGVTSNLPNDSSWSDYFINNTGDGKQINLEYWLGAMDAGQEGSTRSDYACRTGIRSSETLGGVRQAMARELVTAFDTDRFSAEEFLTKGGGGDEGALHELKDDKKNKTYYNIVTKLINTSANTYFYNSYGIAVYDFQLSPIIDPDVGYKDATVTDDPDNPSSKNTFVSYSENRSRETGNVNMEVSESLTQTVSNSITNSESLSFTEGVSNTFKWGTDEDFFSDALTISVSSTEAMETAYTSGTSVESKVENKLSASADLPPHTAVEMVQTVGEENKISTYTCPVALRYKVVFFSMSGYAYSDNIRDNQIQGTESCFSTVFGYGNSDGGYGAPENFKTRIYDSVQWNDDGTYKSYDNSNEMSYGNTHGWYQDGEIRFGIDWGWVFREHNRFKDKNELIATHIPLFGQGASLKVSVSGETSKIGEVRPLYPLTQIKLEEGEGLYELISGDTLNLKGLQVGGYNEYNIPFYGFDKEEGYWVLCDADGNKLDSSDIASLDINISPGSPAVSTALPVDLLISRDAMSLLSSLFPSASQRTQ